MNVAPEISAATRAESPSSLVSKVLSRWRELRADPDARAWGGILREAVMDTLGDDAPMSAVDDLERTLREALSR